MTRHGRESIEEKFLRRGDLFGLTFSEGTVFLEVTDWEPLVFRPHTEFSSISEGGNVQEATFQDSDGDDIFSMETTRTRVIHGSIGINPKPLRMYMRYPASSSGGTQWPNLSNAKATTPTDHGFIDGFDSPYDEPTDDMELFVTPAGQPDFDFANKSEEGQIPVFNLKFRQYEVDILTKTRQKDLEAVQRVVKRGTAPPIAPVGSMSQKVSYGNLTETWGPEGEVVFTDSEVDQVRENPANLGGGRR